MRGRQHTVIHDSPQWHLPEGVKARLGKGSINDIAYSPDGTVLAVASSIGVWLYDASSGEARTLLNQGIGTVFQAFRSVLMAVPLRVGVGTRSFACGISLLTSASRPS